jgi:hypothetical protein
METPEVRTTLRLPPELFQQLKAQARAEKRSWNAQVLYLLEQAARRAEGQRAAS